MLHFEHCIYFLQVKRTNDNLKPRTNGYGNLVKYICKDKNKQIYNFSKITFSKMRYIQS